MAPKLWFVNVESAIPNLETPFAVLLESDEKGWSKGSSLNQRAKNLLAAGCRCFVCFGKQSEEVHDRIDDIIIELGYDNVITTFHCDESMQSVADFFMTIASSTMKDALVLSGNPSEWATYLNKKG